MTTFEDFQASLEALLKDPDMHGTRAKHRILAEVGRIHSRMSDVESKPTIPFHIALTAYTYMLENTCSPQEALEYSALAHGEDGEHLLGMRHNPYYHAKRVVDATDDHSVTQGMKKAGVMCKTTKRSLVQTKTLNSQLTSLNDLLRITDRQRKLEETVMQHEERINALESRTTATEEDVKSILDRMDTLEKVIHLTQVEGWTRKEVAAYLGKSERTVYRMLAKHSDRD